ncbi:MAG: hypothetical protein JXR58_04075 [Bacteroidales bacterium]|nr:hypothetical protein [Bacteroidales bacterium]
MIAKLAKYFLLILFISTSFVSFSQWTCRSKLGASLKPIIKDKPLLWAAEVTLGEGFMNDREIRNAMVFLGFDYSFKKSQFYIEGGFKSWYNSLGAPENLKTPFQQSKPGAREVFYRFRDKKNDLIIGLHSMKIDDYFLVNERGMGLSYRKTKDDWKYNFSLATVGKDFSRFGTFCSVHYLYNLLKDRNLAYLGNKPGQTNFASFIVSWNPSGKKKSKAVSDDGFEEFSEFESDDETKPKFNPLKQLGYLVYGEFGSWIDTMPFYTGVFSKLEFFGVELKIEALIHIKENNNALVINPSIQKTKEWDNGSRTLFSLGYFNKIDIDKNAFVFPSFSNLFAGEALRMDVVDLPLIQMAGRHNFPKYKTQIKAQLVKQFADTDFQEIDMSVGKTFGKHTKLTLMFSRITAKQLLEIFYLGRLELRITI